MGEVDKLEAWGEGRPLSADDVHAVLGRGLGRPLYLLADAAAARDLPLSLEKLEQLLDGGEEGLRILATLHRSLRQVRAAAALARAGTARARIAQALLPPNMSWKLDSLLGAARRWQDADLRRALSALERADRRLKRGTDAATALVAALAEACGEGGTAATSLRTGR
jgi:DNA polymerase III delta subunit